jgi:hypothetical protein
VKWRLEKNGNGKWEGAKLERKENKRKMVQKFEDQLINNNTSWQFAECGGRDNHTLV